ncbi:putative methyltransferase [Clostridium acetireducens DSM 10703]|jgi:DNA modification methylase|uniref:Putative methyltransferase n=1 Tax=Clostridium acetireducens DSM 10703 TaxID=1121290 RepID=A0A1E8EWQ4_9CLOT|nr:hypothetical protein [Clostridium acetireducens]OFI01423.1 putative methyltransferase [Clostridium acetireducens DSM 10703]
MIYFQNENCKLCLGDCNKVLKNRCIIGNNNEKNIILDPFCGSDNKIVDLENKRQFIDIDMQIEYLNLTKKKILQNK